MDTRIKVQEIIPKYNCGPDIVSSNHISIVAEKEIDISDEELMRLGKRFLELVDRSYER